MAKIEVLTGDALFVLRGMAPDSVQCCVTSPPYWGLRDYGAAGQIGIEATPQEYVSKMVEVFREVRRVLKPDGTLWLNLGDSYANDGKCGGSTGGKAVAGPHGRLGPGRGRRESGLKPKDLVGIPWRVAFALQADGWWLRQEIIWAKPNPLPESVRDRCTKAHEQVFLMTKAERYFFDADAIAEPASESTHARLAQNVQDQIGSARAHAGGKTNGNMKAVARRGGGNRSHKHTAAYEAGDVAHRTKAGLVEFSEKQRKLAGAASGIKANVNFDASMAIMPMKRNKRSVWTIGSEPFKGAHFATFPTGLVIPCVLAGSREGDTVLDPFGGAGTVGVVADRLGRNAILIEINPAYAAMAKDRIRGDAPLLAGLT